MSRVAYPFLVLGNDAVESTVWELADSAGKLLPLQKYIEDWDYLRPLNVRKTLKINREIAAIHLGIPEEQLDLCVRVRIGTGPGNMPRNWIQNCNIDASGDNSRFEIDLHIEGRELSCRIRLETLILSGCAPENASSLAPSMGAAKVWSHDFDVSLEGTEPRFPIETVSFEKMFAGRPHVSSLWYLHWLPESIHRDFGGAVRLYVNSDRQDFLERLTENDPLLLHTIMADVMTQMISRVVAMDDAEEAISVSEEGSIGSYIGNWIRIAFPGESISDIRSKLERRPGDFHSGIQTAAEVGGISS